MARCSCQNLGVMVMAGRKALKSVGGKWKSDDGRGSEDDGEADVPVPVPIPVPVLRRLCEVCHGA